MGNMTSDLSTNLITAAIALSALTIISLVALRGWRDWIQLKREELAAGRAPAQDQDPAVPHAGSRIEIADLKERSEEHTSELQSLMRISYAVFCLKKKNNETKK